ncbi:MAG: hypothetical protein KBB86_02705 [Candidatus Pacebacteria bacterium]|nr:hypothetical protein [Candidatus Paceibacterota bacterium]
MKKLAVITVMIMICGTVFAQTDTTKKEFKKSNFGFAGGLWAGTNASTTFVGFIGPKFSYTTAPIKKTQIEVGLNGVPGLMISPEIKLGLCAGATLTFKTENKKFKPIVGVMFVKTKTWQTMYGVGFLF